MPSLFKKSLTVEEAAEALLALMQSDFKQEWRSKMSSVSGLDPIRAEDELVFLDLFAVYFSVKFTHSVDWRANGCAIFENLFGLLAGYFANFWAPKKAILFALLTVGFENAHDSQAVSRSQAEACTKHRVAPFAGKLAFGGISRSHDNKINAGVCSWCG